VVKNVWVIFENPRPSARSAEKSVAELGLWIEADSVLSVSSCKFLFELLKNPLSLRRLENDVAQRNASASVASFELRALCDEKSCLENKILRVCNTDWQIDYPCSSAKSAVSVF